MLPATCVLCGHEPREHNQVLVGGAWECRCSGLLIVDARKVVHVIAGRVPTHAQRMALAKMAPTPCACQGVVAEVAIAR